VSFTSLGTAPPKPDLFPAWNTGLIEVVENALRAAWRDLLATHASVLATRDEDQITNALLDSLAQILTDESVRGFTASFFGMPVRDAKLPDWQGQSIDKTPDITIYPALPRRDIAAARHNALFFECKVLHLNRRLRQYGADGIQRYLDGRYAWRMPHAHMVAYVFVAKDRHPLSALTEHFKAKVANGQSQTHGERLGLSKGPSEVLNEGCPNTRPVVETSHSRTAPLIAGVAPPIALRHVWLCDPA
jgi:hypothetical protein